MTASIDLDATSWTAQWISHGPVRDLTDPIVGLGSDETKAPFGRYLFSTELELDAVPASAPVRLTADSRYVLFCNGHEVGRGPARSQPRRLQYDVRDLAPHLRVGANTVVVLVTYYGDANSFWFPAAGNPTIGRRPVMVLEGTVGEVEVRTDATWRSAAMPAWTLAEEVGGGGLPGVPVEVVDAAALPAGWRTGDGVTWEQATVLHAAHLGSLARSTPPTDPYGPLVRRPIGDLTGETVAPTHARWERVLGAPTGGDAVSRAISVLSLPAEEVGDTVDVAASGPVLHGVLDMGRVVAGLVSVDIVAPAGSRVDLHYREAAPRPGAGDPMSLPLTGATYLARGVDDRFDALEVNGFRYVHVVVDAPEGAEVRVSGLRVRETLYRMAGEAYFASDDEELDRLWRAGVRTVELNSQDAFIDCPTREQRAWVGDGVVHQMVHLAASTDWRLAWQYLQLGNSPRSDGILPMTVAGETEHGGGVTIPDWSLYWIRGVHEMHRHSDEVETLRDLLRTAEGIVRWYLPYVTDDGVVADVPEWNLVDWSSVLLTGRSSLLTAMWAAALGHVAEIAERLGDHGTAAWARALVERARAGFEQFWDPERGTYVDHVLDGERREAASQLAGALAIVSGLAPEERWPGIVAWISDPDRVVVRSWIGEDGGYSAEKILDQMRGVQRIDWDARGQTVSAEPFASFLVHDALARAGRVDLVVRNMRRWSVFLADGYDTFGECWGWGTPVHGWSSTPTRDLTRYVLGVSPAAPGFGSVRVAPAYGVVSRFEGAAPTPAGLIRVAVDGGAVTVDSPLPVELVRPDGTVELLDPGRHSR